MIANYVAHCCNFGAQFWCTMLKSVIIQSVQKSVIIQSVQKSVVVTLVV